MSDTRRILDRQSEASALARDLVGSARDDQPAAGAKARARAQLERTLGGEGITTHISSLSAAMADLKLAAPVLAPTPLAPLATSEPVATSSGASRAWVLYASIAAAGIIAVGGVGIALVLRGSSPQNVAVQQAAPPPATPNTTAAAAPGPTPAPTPTPAAPAGGTTVAANTETPGAAAAGGGAAEPAHERSGGGASGGSRGARERSTGSGGGGGGSTASAGGGGGSTASAGGGGGQSCAQRCHGDIDCLLRCGTASPASGGGSHPASGGGGGGGGGGAGSRPEAPSRSDVIAAMGGVRGAVQSCGHGMTGTASVSITFASSGRVTMANVSPPFVGTPTGSCIARAVRSASVHPFTRPTFTVNYPFVIH